MLAVLQGMYHRLGSRLRRISVVAQGCIYSKNESAKVLDAPTKVLLQETGYACDRMEFRVNPNLGATCELHIYRYRAKFSLWNYQVFMPEAPGSDMAGISPDD